MLQSGQRLGDFEIIRLLGKGGMGEVYEARQNHPERRVALKILAPWLAEDVDAFERFRREERALAQLDHPGIVRIIASGQAHGVVYYAMQLIHGISLAALMRWSRDTDELGTPPASPGTTSHADEGPKDNLTKPYHPTLQFLPEAPELVQAYWKDRYHTTARLGLQIAQALASAHRADLVHRDLKPSNIMLDRHNHVYVVDFGLTRILDVGSAVTQAGTILGTPWFMSPEQAERKPVDCRSDIFSLGVTMYQLATGGNGPYTADRSDTPSVLHQVRTGAIVPLSTLAPGIAPELAAIIERAMAVDPGQRFASAAELAEALQEYVKDSPEVDTERVAPLARRRRWWWLAAPATVLVAVAVTIWLSTRDRGDPEVRPPDFKQKPMVPEDPFGSRVRPLNLRLPLLREDNQPELWKVLLGEGKLQPFAKELVLRSMDKQKPFLLALDDPKNTAFEFRVEMRPRQEQIKPLDDLPSRHDMGLFFGWCDKTPDPRTFPRFFVLTLDSRSVLGDIHGRLSLGTWCFLSPAPEIDLPFEEIPVPLRGPAWIGLPDHHHERFFEVRIRVQHREVSISLDQEPPLRFDLDEILRQNPKLQQAHVQFSGPVGLWVRDGLGHFRNATIMAIPPARP